MVFKKFARSHVGIITKYGCSVRKHIEEGICLPATDAFLSLYIPVDVDNPCVSYGFGVVTTMV